MQCAHSVINLRLVTVNNKHIALSFGLEKIIGMISLFHPLSWLTDTDNNLDDLSLSSAVNLGW